MPTQAGDLIDSISRRVRDANNTAHSRSVVRDLLDRAQVAVNAATRSVLVSESLATTAAQTLYSVESDLSATVEILAILHNNRYLDHIMPWRNLTKLDRSWFTAQGPVEGFAKIGRDLFALYKSPAPPAPSLTVVGIKRTNELTLDTTTLELDEEKETIAMDLVVALLLLRQRDLDMVGDEKQITDIINKIAEKLDVQAEPVI